MTTVTTTLAQTAVEPKPAGFLSDTLAIAGRALRAVPRDLEAVIPPVFISIFFFLVNIGTLKEMSEQTLGGLDFEAFMMGTAVLLGVTGVSRAPAFVVDVQNGYFDRLLLTPVSRLAILLGHMAADVAVAMALTIPNIAVGLVLGVDIEAGPVGLLAFMVLASLWSLAFAGFGYAIALRTGNPAAVNTSFLLFFPFLFLTSSYVPRSHLSGWLDNVAAVNPVTYLLDGLRSLLMVGWEWGELSQALLAIAVVAAISLSMCFSALRGRLKRG